MNLHQEQTITATLSPDEAIVLWKILGATSTHWEKTEARLSDEQCLLSERLYNSLEEWRMADPRVNLSSLHDPKP